MSQSQAAMRARAARRRHLQQRQTVIFGTLIAALIVIALLAGAMWSGVIGSPVSVPINSGQPAVSPEAVVPPCPPEGAKPVPYDEITVNVFNGTDTQSLAAQTAAALRDVGISTGVEQNGVPYGGVVQLTTGPVGVSAAYTVAGLFAESQIVLDTREDASVDVLIGSRYEDLVPLEEATLDPETAIQAPENCQPVATEDEG